MICYKYKYKKLKKLSNYLGDTEYSSSVLSGSSSLVPIRGEPEPDGDIVPSGYKFRLKVNNNAFSKTQCNAKISTCKSKLHVVTSFHYVSHFKFTFLCHILVSQINNNRINP